MPPVKNGQGTFPKKGEKAVQSVKKVTKKIKKKSVTFKKMEKAPVKPQFYQEDESEDDSAQIPTVNVKGGRNQVQKKIPEVTIESSSSEDSDFDQDEPEEVPTNRRLPMTSGDMDDEEEEEAGDEEDEEEEDESAAVVKKFRNEMSNLPLSEVRKMREKLGMKLFDKLYFDNQTPETEEKSKKKKEKEAAKEEKKGQHRPREISSKKKVGTFRNVYKNERLEKKRWDPRFDERAGDLKEHCFEDNYQFLQDMKQSEKEELRKELAACVEEGDRGKSERIAKAIRRMEDHERSYKEKQLKKAAMNDIRQENIDRLMSGEKAKFLTKAQVRMKVMEKKYEQLKTEKRLDTYLQKKAKKQAQKEKKKKGMFESQPFEAKYGYQ